jgi:hypothetical protein
MNNNQCDICNLSSLPVVMFLNHWRCHLCLQFLFLNNHKTILGHSDTITLSCDKCETDHEGLVKVLLDNIHHELIPSTCTLHTEQPINGYCNSCNIFICYDCFGASHSDHVIRYGDKFHCYQHKSENICTKYCKTCNSYLCEVCLNIRISRKKKSRLKNRNRYKKHTLHEVIPIEKYIKENNFQIDDDSSTKEGYDEVLENCKENITRLGLMKQLAERVNSVKTDVKRNKTEKVNMYYENVMRVLCNRSFIKHEKRESDFKMWGGLNEELIFLETALKKISLLTKDIKEKDST